MEKEDKKIEENLYDKTSKIINDVKDDSKNFDKKDIEDGKGMGILCYLGILVIIPFLSEKKNKYVLYHAKQGLNLMIWDIIVCIVIGVINSLLWRMGFVTYIIDTAFELLLAILSLIGIINVCNGKAKELPLINKFKIIK